MAVCERGKPNVHLFQFPPHLRMLSDSRRCRHIRTHRWSDFLEVTHCKQNEDVTGDDVDPTVTVLTVKTRSEGAGQSVMIQGRGQVGAHDRVLDAPRDRAPLPRERLREGRA